MKSDDMIKRIIELENKEFDLKKQIIGEKIKYILEIAKAGEKIPRQLELTKEELRLLQDIMTDKESDDNKDGKGDKTYWERELESETAIRNGTLIKIENILLCLDGISSYYITAEDFEENFKERKENNEDLENFLYFKVDSLKEEEFFELFMEIKKHDISEIKDVISDRTEENMRKTAGEIEDGSREKKQPNITKEEDDD